LALPVIEEISEHITGLNRDAPRDYRANMTTNGFLLTLPVAERLCSLGISHYQISLDGPEDTHNLTRKRADGSGSYSVIWDNLIALRDSPLNFEITLRVHFHRQNLDSLDQLIADIQQNFLSDSRFKVFFKGTARLGGENDDSIPVFEREERSAVKTMLQRKLGHDPSPSEIEFESSYICYASKPNSLVVRSDGSLAKCTVAFRDQGNDIGRLGRDGSIQVDQEKLRWWARGFGSLDEAVLGCPHVAREPATAVFNILA
jgi:uncharacterized protein